MTTGHVHSFESLGALDGPGLRFVVFLSGCPLRCLYCHNPDTWDICAGKEMTPDEIVKKAMRYQPYFANGGGLTLSGGEPLMQPKFALGILRGCREVGISTCVDTAGSVLNDEVKAALAYADLVMLDVKHTDAVKNKALTGGNIETNMAVLEYCKDIQIPLWIRQVILPGWNDTAEDMESLLRYINGANVQKIELLPYHTLGVYKWEALGLTYQLKELAPPSEDQMDRLREIVTKHNQFYS